MVWKTQTSTPNFQKYRKKIFTYFVGLPLQLQYDIYNSKLTSQRQKVDSVEKDTNKLKQDIAALLEKVSHEMP